MCRAKGFYSHLAVYAIISLFLIFVNLVTDSSGLWFYWPIAGWGSVIVIHAIMVFGPLAGTGSGWEERKIRKYMERDR